MLIVNKVNATDLSFANHPRLKAIQAKTNLIGQVSDVIPYLGPNIIKIDLTGNPVVKQRGIFEFICQKCPRLRQYNGKEVTEQQVKFGALKASKM